MKVYNLDIDIDQFWFNYWELKNSSNIALPMDTVKLTCECEHEIIVFPNGEYFSESKLLSAEQIVKQEIDEAVKTHKDLHKCQSSVVNMEPPENIILMVKNMAHDGVEPFSVLGFNFIPKVLVMRHKTPAMIMFQNKASLNRTYSSFVGQNFKSILNSHNHQGVREEDIEDDDSASASQHQRPRLVGGGRKMLQDFKYICQWCSPETLSKPTRGRFREIKNYRDHFRAKHGDTVPFAEFLNKVERDDPKFYCKICKQKVSLGNQLRHQIICRPQEYEQHDDNDDTDDPDTESENNEDPSNSELPSPTQQNTNEDDTEQDDNNKRHRDDSSVSSDEPVPHKLIKIRALNSSSSSDSDDRPTAIAKIVAKISSLLIQH